MKKLLIITAILLLLPITSMAGKATFTIKGIGVSDASDSLFINVNEDIKLTTCEKTKTLRLVKEGSDVFAEILTLAITAKSMGNAVTISYNDAECVHGSSTIRYLYLR